MAGRRTPKPAEYHNQGLADVAVALESMTGGLSKGLPRENLQRPQIRRALVAVDGSYGSQHALNWACYLSKALGLELTVVTVGPSPEVARALRAGTGTWQALAVTYDESDETCHKSIERAKAHLKEAGVKASFELKHGGAARSIIELAKSIKADLVILGAHGHGVGERLALGNVGSNVKHHVACSVLIARNDPANRPLVLATDGSERSRLAVEVGLEWAEALKAKPILAHAIDPGAYGLQSAFTTRAAKQMLADAAKGARPQSFDGAVGPGSAAQYLRDLADDRKAGLIVVGSRGLGGLRSVTLGSISDRLSHKAKQSILIVKPQAE